MPRIDYGASIKLLVSVRGHPFDRNGFDSVFSNLDDVSATMVDQPAAALLMRPEAMTDFDVLVLYDMPGLDLRDGPHRPIVVEPNAAVKEGLSRLLDCGKGVLALHHALAGWPSWPEYGEWLGGRFLYRPGVVRGRMRSDSGYRHDVKHSLHVVAEHPVMTGLPREFEMVDELYLAEVFEDDLLPLLTSSYGYAAENFWSASAAMDGSVFSRDGWSHPPGSNIVGWVKRARRSPLVYLQAGDGIVAYENPYFRQLVANAVRWLASPQSLEWARQV